MVIPQEVENKIKYLCNKMPDLEWSGVLFYSVEGSWKDHNLVVTCRDILLMDIGTSTSTEFNSSVEVAAHICEYNLENCYLGLIHSHNKMETFFSGTDYNTLIEEGASTNHFVSLIVNNAGKYTARITRTLQYGSSQYYTFDNRLVLEEGGKKVVQHALLHIEKQSYSDSILDEAIDRILSSKKALETPKYVTQAYPTLFPIVESNYDYEDEAEIIRNQLIYGSILVGKRSKKEIDAWMLKMESLFDKRFNNLFDYGIYIGTMLDLLINVKGNKYSEIDFLNCIIDKIKEVKQNKYTEEIIKEIEAWI